MAGTDFSHLTSDELIKGIKALKLPDYIRSKAYGIDVRETLAQMTEMTIQLGVNMGLSPDDALLWARKLQESVSQSEFDSWVATLLDGGPSIFMNTLSELQTTYPNGAPGVALVRETDPAKIYVWNGTAWEDFGDYQGIEIKDGSVTDAKVSNEVYKHVDENYAGLKRNIFTTDGMTVDHYVGYKDGILIPQTGYNTTKKIRIKPNTKYFLLNVQQLVYLNVNGGYVGGVTGESMVTTPSTAAYIQLTYAAKYEKNVMVIESEKPINYVSLSVSRLDESVLPEDLVRTEKINLLNVEDVQANKYVSYSTGEILTSTGYHVTGFIHVGPSTKYYIYNGQQLAFYTAAGEYISGQVTSAKMIVTAPSNAYLMRVTIQLNKLNEFMIVQSDKEVPYVSPEKKQISMDIIPSELLQSAPLEVKILLPSEIYMVTNEEFSIYFRNILTNNIDIDNYDVVIREIDGTGHKQLGRHLNYKWFWTPTTAGNKTMEIRVYDAINATIVASKTFTIKVKDKLLQSVSSPNIVTIGDSFADGWGVSKNIYEMMTSDPNNQPNFIGLHSTGVDGVYDDAWSGYSYNWYANTASGYKREDRSDGTATTTPNQFYNPTTKKFDFTYYMSTYQNNAEVDIVQSLLGINDSLLQDMDNMVLGLPKLLDDIEAMWNSILNYDNSITILPILITPLNALNDGFIGGYGSGTTWNSPKLSMRKVEIFNEAMLERFGTQSWRDKGVHLVAVNANWDYRYGVRTGTIKPIKFDQSIQEVHTIDIHPNLEIGSKYIADSMRNAIRHFQD